MLGGVHRGGRHWGGDCHREKTVHACAAVSHTLTGARRPPRLGARPAGAAVRSAYGGAWSDSSLSA